MKSFLKKQIGKYIILKCIYRIFYIFVNNIRLLFGKMTADKFYSQRNAMQHAQVYQAMTTQNHRIAELLKSAHLQDEATFPALESGPVEPHLSFEAIPKKLLDTAFAGLAKYQKNFASLFQKLSKNDLIVAGFFLIINKPE